ncbi:MAG: serine/threonine-protein kinase [Cyanobacteria bacterium P01_E01_bin.34]
MLLSNRYQIIRALGEGGFGKTFLGEDTQLPSKPQCVVKELKPLQEIDFEEVLKRFEQEAAILDKLGQQHPQIPQLFAYFADNGKFYLVQEYVEGETLASRIAKGGALSEMDVYRLLCQTLPILSYIHQEGVIHRDIKPDNIILRASDGMPILIDFGAVKERLGQVGAAINPTTASRTISIGTLGFMSTEQGLGRPVFSSDIFSLGMTAIYALTAKGPQSLPTNPGSGLLEWKNPGTPLNISPRFAEILDRAIQPFSNDRYASADDMLTALQAMNQTQPGQTTRPTPTVDINQPTIAPTTLSIPYPNSPAGATNPAAGNPEIAETTYSSGRSPQPPNPAVPPASSTPAQPALGGYVPGQAYTPGQVYTPGQAYTTGQSAPNNPQVPSPGQPVSQPAAPVPSPSAPPSGAPYGSGVSNVNASSVPVPTPQKSSTFPWLIGCIGAPLALVGLLVVVLISIGLSVSDDDNPTGGDPGPTTINTPRPTLSPPSTNTTPPPTSPPSFSGGPTAPNFSATLATCGSDYCDVDVFPGFTPNPTYATGAVGGERNAIDATGVNNSETGKCLGFIDSTPDHYVNLSQPMDYLAIGVNSTEDTSIIIIEPDGNPLCHSGADPFIEGPFPKTGAYSIYIGNLAEIGVGPRYRIYVTTDDPNG